MTLYRNPWTLRHGSRKHRKFWHFDTNKYKVRANFAYGQQWKRYPKCQAMFDLQRGQKTHTWIIPERSYAQYYEEWDR